MPTLIVYGSGKLMAYTLLCYVGLRLFRGKMVGFPAAAVGLGLLRFIMGLCFGMGIYVVSTQLYASIISLPLPGLIVYLLVYVPTRWVEWSIMTLILVVDARSCSGFILGAGTPDRLWRLGGIITSCVADVPMIREVGGLPVGRFFC